jgi:hypothetical protein
MISFEQVVSLTKGPTMKSISERAPLQGSGCV